MSVNVIAAAKVFLEGSWTKLPIVEPNTRKATTPADGAPYVIIQRPYCSAERVTFGAPGANVYREEGGLRFVVNVERGTGINEGLAWAAEIAAVFRGQRFEGIETFAPTSPVFDDGNENGNYFALSFAVPYQLDVLG